MKVKWGVGALLGEERVSRGGGGGGWGGGVADQA